MKGKKVLILLIYILGIHLHGAEKVENIQEASEVAISNFFGIQYNASNESTTGIKKGNFNKTCDFSAYFSDLGGSQRSIRYYYFHWYNSSKNNIYRIAIFNSIKETKKVTSSHTAWEKLPKNFRKNAYSLKIKVSDAVIDKDPLSMTKREIIYVPGYLGAIDLVLCKVHDQWVTIYDSRSQVIEGIFNALTVDQKLTVAEPVPKGPKFDENVKYFQDNNRNWFMGIEEEHTEDDYDIFYDPEDERLALKKAQEKKTSNEQLESYLKNLEQKVANTDQNETNLTQRWWIGVSILACITLIIGVGLKKVWKG